MKNYSRRKINNSKTTSTPSSSSGRATKIIASESPSSPRCASTGANSASSSTPPRCAPSGKASCATSAAVPSRSAGKIAERLGTAADVAHDAFPDGAHLGGVLEEAEFAPVLAQRGDEGDSEAMIFVARPEELDGVEVVLE